MEQQSAEPEQAPSQRVASLRQIRQVPPLQSESRDLRNGLVILSLIALLIGGGCWLYISNERQVRAQQEQRAEAQRAAEKRIRDSISSLASRYGAISDWKTKLHKSSPLDPIYGAELSDLLVRPDGVPMLLIAKVTDVSKDQDHYLATLHVALNLATDLRLQLMSTPEQAQVFMRLNPLLLEKAAIVARIDGVARLAQQSEEAGKSTLGATGRCLDVLPLGTYVNDEVEIVGLEPKKDH